MEKLINSSKPNLVIHSAAQRFPDQMEKEPEKSWNLNVDTTQHLAKTTIANGGRMIYISTDYVFAGDSPPYSADMEANPTNVYGKSKLAGEKVALATDSGNLVLRVPVLYGDVKTTKESALTCLLDTVREKDKTAKISSYEKRNPAHTEDIANILLDMANKLETLPGGVYQWSGLEKISKWDIVQLISKQLNMPIDHLEEVAGPTAGGVPRPMDVEMDRGNLMGRGIKHHTDFNTGFMNCLKPFL